MSRMKPLAIDECLDDELKQAFQHFMNTLGFVPNSLLTMQRVPSIAKSVIQMNKAVFAHDCIVDNGFKRLVAHMASQASGCQYYKAHTSVSDKERVALDFALAAASVPNDVTDDLYDKLSALWSEVEIVEITILKLNMLTGRRHREIRF